MMSSMLPKRWRADRSLFLSLLAFVVALGLTQGARAEGLETYRELEQATQRLSDGLIEATVGIAAKGTPGMGSGVVVSEDGLILTAGHVIHQPGQELTVLFSDGRVANAVALGIDHGRDAGMAQITDDGPWPFAEVGQSEGLAPGDWCLAVGHPGGVQRDRTAPVRLGRLLSSPSTDPDAFGGIVTDATVISGDSGGPLFDLEGRVIGIHSNIGFRVTENRHVAIGVFHEQWEALLAGEEIGKAPGGIGAAPGGGFEGLGGQGDLPDMARFQELLMQRLQAGDPEVMEMVQGGTMMLTPEQMQELLQKWEAEADGDASEDDADTDGGDTDTNEQADADEARGDDPDDVQGLPPGTDLARFQELMTRRLEAGDPEVMEMVQSGTLTLTPQRMAELIRKWEAAEAGEDTGDAQPQDGEDADAPQDVELELDIETLREFSLEDMFGDTSHGKGHDNLLSEFATLADSAQHSTVQITRDGEPCVLGTVVREDGYILTKASELGGELACRIGEDTLPATLVAQDDEHDLALLKVDAAGLTPAAWDTDTDPAIGTWLVTPDAEGAPIALGIVGVASRPIPEAPQTAIGRNKAAAGISLDPIREEARAQALAPGGPAERAGVLPGDEIVSVDGQTVEDKFDLVNILGTYEPGDTVTLGIKRGGETLDIELTLGEMQGMSFPQIPGGGGGAEDTINRMSGHTFSERANNFPMAFTHDSVFNADQCGGPILGLDGKALGLNIARAGRTASYAIPASQLQPIIQNLLEQAE